MKIRKTISAFFAISGLLLLGACGGGGGGSSDSGDPSIGYAVGDTGPAGGIIFYVGASYALEAAPTDASTSQAWSNITSALGTTSSAIGSGLSNTNAIVSQSGHTGSAAKVCLDYSVTNNGTVYDDWFLPSYNELDQMYESLHDNTSANFPSTAYYWSSTEQGLGNVAYSRNLNSGSLSNSNKDLTLYVRPIRFVY